jgi:hypothetical protein
MPRPSFRVVAVAFACLILVPAVALAQATVRVTADRATLWRPGFGSVITVVAENVELDVVGRQGDWLEVVVPAGSSEDRRTGLISIKQVTLVTGTLPADSSSQPGAALPRPGVGARPSPFQRAGQPAAPLGPRDTGIRGFADVSYHFFTARDTFKAVLDQPGGPFVGGGGELRLGNGLFVQGAVRWFRQTGERVFVLDDEVFPLGIEDTITIVPISATAGFRLRSRGVVPYVGGGVGVYRFQETSEFEDPAEKIEEDFKSFHILGGAEWRTRSWWAAAFEIQYTFVPDSLEGGLAEIFDERDLGGLDLRFKLVIGR